MNGYHAVDLDGTLAIYEGWEGMTHIGPPVPKMLARVKNWLDRGEEVRILTARADPDNEEYDDFMRVLAEWCTHYVGRPLQASNKKCFRLIDLWDDRAVGVIFNTGERCDGLQE